MNSKIYINLARKYRPQTVKDLIGQEALVTTLQNAFSLNRIAHAFILTGVRGVGKTTTARIIAKALNCVGHDCQGEATLNPCGVCEHCIAITNDRHLDVIEMDAASRTGVDDIRAIIENAKYNPVTARYKVFIIDEVHMLSKNAFNALLKTLEEPPPQLKFIFATTEIRKVPITVLSRCQRFDLQRISLDDLSHNLAKICTAEKISYEEPALFLLAKAANGSARDSLSLLDQAIVYGDITEQNAIKMLGQGSINEIYDLFTSLIKADSQQSFLYLEQQYKKGIELSLLFEDLLEVCHNVTMYKLLEEPSNNLSEFEASSANKIAKITSLPELIKVWQILLQGIEEINKSTLGINTARMIIAKLSLTSSLGDVDKIINFINKNSEIATTETTTTILPSSIDNAKPIIAPIIANNPLSAHVATKNPSTHDESLIKKDDNQLDSLSSTPINTGEDITADITKQVLSIFPTAKKIN